MLAPPGIRRQAEDMPPITSTHPPERRLRAIAFRAISATAFALMSALLKGASERGVTTPEMIFYRNGFALFVVAAWLATGPGWGAIRTRQPLAHLTRSLIGFISMLLTFGALALLPLGTATTLTYAAPILATILSGLVLGEVIGRRRWIAVAIGFAGVLLVVRPGGGGGLPALGVAVGLGAALGQSCVMITLRQIGRTESIAAIVWWFSVFTTLAGALMLPVFGHRHDLWTFAMLAAAGLLGGVGQIAMTASLRLAPVAVVVPFDYLQIVWATAIGWLAFGAAPTAVMLTGAALIAGSGIYTAFRERGHGRASNQALALDE